MTQPASSPASSPAAAAFDEAHTLHALRHHLPAQAPLKDFIHHNTLHGFQDAAFFEGLRRASAIFGYQTTLPLAEYRALYHSGRIRPEVVDRVLTGHVGPAAPEWRTRLLSTAYGSPAPPRIGRLRAQWKAAYRLDLDSLVHPTLFRILCSYLDQGISIWKFPLQPGQGLLTAVRTLERDALASFFRGPRARKLLLETPCELPDLLAQLVGDARLFERYLFDQQFAHPGWSGMVATIEAEPQTLLDRRAVTLADLLRLELLLEIDALESVRGTDWQPLTQLLGTTAAPLLADDLFGLVSLTEAAQVLAFWQEAYEWSYYDNVLAGIRQDIALPTAAAAAKPFQALFCIDDRECSIRRYLEQQAPDCETFGTPGFFGVAFYFQSAESHHYEKVCPAPVNPGFLIKEVDVAAQRQTDVHFSKHAHSLHSGWLLAPTVGFWSALRLAAHLLRPQLSAAAASSFRHMHQRARLTIEHQPGTPPENGLQIGFTVPEMAERVEAQLRSIGLVEAFAPLVYVVGHGASSANNPHYAAYDCGACSGRAGSVNARVLSAMANHPAVRVALRARGLDIPATSWFVGALHDTTRDEIAFFDEDTIPAALQAQHQQNTATFSTALDLNARERSRRFASIDTRLSLRRIHDKIRARAVSLFEPRPELNHATNALCVVGRRDLTRRLLLDRRAFLNSYDYRLDPTGDLLLNILKAAAPVCGGINLEYYFSRVDNLRLGAGTKLPHNVMGLFGVANGADGDLRPGLPSQMIEVHDPVRLLLIVEQTPERVLDVIRRVPATYEWFGNEWVNLVVAHPETGRLYRFREGAFEPYVPSGPQPSAVSSAGLKPLVEAEADNLPVLALTA